MAYKKSWLKSYQNRLKNYDDTVIYLLTKIEDIKKEKEELNILMLLSPSTLEETICKKYIEVGRLKEVYIWLNDEGYRIVSSERKVRKYGTNDISEHIRQQGKNKDNRFGIEALKLFKMNTPDTF